MFVFGRLNVEQPAAIKKRAKVSIMRNRFTGLFPSLNQVALALTKAVGPVRLIFRRFFRWGASRPGSRRFSVLQVSKESHCQQPLKLFFVAQFFILQFWPQPPVLQEPFLQRIFIIAPKSS